MERPAKPQQAVKEVLLSVHSVYPLQAAVEHLAEAAAGVSKHQPPSIAADVLLVIGLRCLKIAVCGPACVTIVLSAIAQPA